MAKDAQLERLIEARELALSIKKAAQEEVRARQYAVQSFVRIKNRAFQTREETKTTLNDINKALVDGHRRIGPLIAAVRSSRKSFLRDAHEDTFDVRTIHRLKKPQRTRKHLREVAQSYALRAYKHDSLRTLKCELAKLHAQHKEAEIAYNNARAGLLGAQQHLKVLVAEKETAQNALDTAVQAANQADQAYQEKLKELQLFYKTRSADLARQAGVPSAYIEATLAAYKPDGSINLYFGGEGRPNGKYHGHYILNPEGRVSYRRNPYQKRGES